jgi:hypothetical protein
MQADYDRSTEYGNAAAPNDCMRLVASRRHALESLRTAASVHPPRPVLISGEPGAGKASLIHQFVADAQAHWRIARVDLAAEMNAVEFLRLAGHPLGVSASSRLGKARIRLEDALADQSTEGRRWLLVVNQAHRGRSGVWDEVQTVANQLGRPRGFAALFVVGASNLARLLASRRSSLGLAALLSLHIHLKPIDLDEARELVEAARAIGPVDELTLEDLHRKSHGNPALLLRLAQAWVQRRLVGSGASGGRTELFNVRGIEHRCATPLADPSDLDAEARPDLSHEIVKEQSGSTRPAVRGLSRAEAPALIPSKPPLRDEEGLVEVGWEGDLEDELSAPERPPVDPASFLPHESPLDEELIEDHYAALQAISERTRSEAWLTAGAPGTEQGETAANISVETGQSAERSQEARPAATAAAPGGIRAEGQHEFAPYSQLFTRFRQSK